MVAVQLLGGAGADCWPAGAAAVGVLEDVPRIAAQPARPCAGKPRKTLRQAIVQIAVADLSMSLDNVLAVAGAARAHLWIMVAGLVLSVVLMGVAASLLARLLNRYRWVAWLGLATVLFVALRMIWEGGREVEPVVLRWAGTR